MNNKKVIVIITLVIILCVLGCWCTYHFIVKKNDIKLEPIVKGTGNAKLVGNDVIDDWQYSVNDNYEEHTAILAETSVGTTAGGISTKGITGSVNKSLAADSTLGFSVGGAKNIENFRENIKNGYFPISTDITYNGLFYDYYFDTGSVNASDELFSPTYSTAVSKDPISGKYEYYMTVGLNSNIKESDFKRKKLNLVVVMDISGSMSSNFNSYYYDGNRNSENSRSKMQIANESLNLLIDELNPDDRLGVVLFDDTAYLAKPLNLMDRVDVGKLKEHVLEVQAQGGTNFEAGYSQGTSLFNESELEDSEEYENRIIVITDAMPNMGTTNREDLSKDIKENAEKGIYTTFVGVGVDFNTDVVECLSNTRGSNYYSVHSSEEFKKIMGEDFDYMVTPLVFDLKLKLDSDSFYIENVYGTDSRDYTDGTVLNVNTLFPSSSNSEGESKGGIILLKLKCKASCGTGLEYENIALKVSYNDRDGNAHSNTQNVQFGNINTENYTSTGIRKGIVLVRYANLMKNWILYERSNGKDVFYIDTNSGISDGNYTKEQINKLLGENERISVKLSVSEEYAENFRRFKEYMEKEISEIGDFEMKQEIEILNSVTNQ